MNAQPFRPTGRDFRFGPVQLMSAGALVADRNWSIEPVYRRPDGRPCASKWSKLGTKRPHSTALARWLEMDCHFAPTGGQHRPVVGYAPLIQDQVLRALCIDTDRGT